MYRLCTIFGSCHRVGIHGRIELRLKKPSAKSQKYVLRVKVFTKVKDFCFIVGSFLHYQHLFPCILMG